MSKQQSDSSFQKQTPVGQNRVSRAVVNPEFMPLISQLEEIKGELPKARGSGKVLVWRDLSLQKKPMAIELVVASALAMRGAEATMVLCDGVLSGCLLRSIEQARPVADWPRTCQACHATGLAVLEATNLPHKSLGRWLDRLRVAQLREVAETIPFDRLSSYCYESIPVGLLALSSAERYFKGLGVNTDETSQRIAREYFFSGLVSTEAAKGALEEIDPTCIFMSHGIYVDWGPIFQLALARRIPVIRWRLSDLKNHIILHRSTENPTHGISYIDSEVWQNRANAPLESWENALLDEYMRERCIGLRDKIKLQSNPPSDPKSLRRKLQLPDDKPLWGVFTHLNWDAVFAYSQKSLFHPNEWVIDTLKYVQNIQEVVWIVKIHPVESHFPITKGIADYIRESFPSLPSNVRLIPPETDINTYGLLRILTGGVTMQGTVGLELSMMGKPVILAGEAHYGSKCFTYDGLTREQYFGYLRKASSLTTLEPNQIELARRYAYNYFIERQVPLNFMSGGVYLGKEEIKLHFESLDGLKPGRDPALDMLCERILRGGEFILDKEYLYGQWQRLQRAAGDVSEGDQPDQVCGRMNGGQDRIANLCRQGEELAMQGDLDRALELMHSALVLGPDNAKVISNIGAIYWAMAQPKKALEQFILALEVNPNEEDVIHNCAEVFKASTSFDDDETRYLLFKLFLMMAGS